jgi:choline monooxygenase
MNLPIQALRERITSQDLGAVNQPIAEARGMPNPAYTDREFFTFERDNILAKNWTAISFVANIDPSSVKPVDFMGRPILISRTREGDVQVFHNVCSHRGMKLVREERKTNGLVVCPYHSWTYSVEGALKATPHIGGVGVHQTDGFNCKSHGLKPIRFHIWLGIIFINLSGDAAPFEEDAAIAIDRYRKLMGSNGEDLMRIPVSDGGLTMTVNCNWKLAVENYLEAYHLPFIHPDLNSYSPLTEHSPEIFSDKCSGQVTATFDPKLDSENPFPLFPDWHPEQMRVGEYPVIYPNLMLGFQANHLFALIVHPVSPTECREELALFYAGEEINETEFDAPRKANLNTWAQVFNEDIEPCERMQIGRNSPGYQGGAFSPILDKCSHHFHQWIAQQYQQAYNGATS